ncbi:TBC1 domain family member 30-like isoform X2 [Sipha flava]|uniref:TBC1 domain family member 30 n=1 Tax=Sipha flava TaxID=143950 RepID=A0A2S2QUE9_9HEMI|nr:TBC1 domain family member 30-like isoform X2 [Sipha flava]
MTVTRYFTVDSIVQPVQPAASAVVPTATDEDDAMVTVYARDRSHPIAIPAATPATPTTTASVSCSPQPRPVQPTTADPVIGQQPAVVCRQSSTTTTAEATITMVMDNLTSQNALQKRYSNTDLMDKLLEDIYRVGSSSGASESSTDQTNWSDGGRNTITSSCKGWSKRLARKSMEELSTTVDLLRDQLNVCCDSLVKALKRRDILIARRDAKCNMITALLHAYSMKRSEDTKMRFNMKPGPGDSDFEQWQSAMKMVARLPDGVPHEFRNTLWLTLAEKYLKSRNVEWAKVERFCFNDTTNPDDEELGVQIVKDLHRTGCSLFCGSSGLENQALLKRVLLGFARWNKAVGYCQGFNMLAALILQVMEKNESDALKVMIYLIEGVLPEGYFANNLRGLSVDMAVFRDLLRVRLQNLSRHLDRLQTESKDSGTSYEPPLTNVFTMQWFLTLFCNCLPQRTVLRVWDLIFLEGSTVLLKTALAIWDALSDRIMTVTSADEFYSIMAVLTREMLEFGLMDANNLINTISTMNELVEVKELRERYMYNINPWVSHMAKRGLRLFYTESDVEETDSDDDIDSKSTVVVASNDTSKTRNSKTGRGNRQPTPSLESEREKVALDISLLKKQYSKLKERQKQVQVILTAACNGQNFISTSNSSAMNHLLFGKTALRCTSIGPIPGSIPLKYIQDVKKPEVKIDPRVVEKRTVSTSSSTSSTSTELCDDPASDCSSERSVKDNGRDDGDTCNDCDRNQMGDDVKSCYDCDRSWTEDGADDVVGPVVEKQYNDVVEDDQEVDDVSLAEMLRANSELLDRMCRGDGEGTSVITPPEKTSVVDLEDRLPDLINDIDVFSGSLVTASEPKSGGSLADVSSGGLDGESRLSPTQSGAAEDNDFSGDDRAVTVKPFDPFPSKARQPKRLSIELGLYPDSSN